MPKIVDKEARKKEIIEAALKVFAKRGVANTRMIEIAEAAGIGKGTIYEYFTDKNEIFVNAFEHFINMMNSVMAKKVFMLKDPIDKLKALINGWVEIINEIGYEFIEIMLEFWAEGIRTKQNFTEAPINMNKMYSEYRAFIKSILDEGVAAGQFREMNTMLTAAILIGALDGIMIQWILDKSIFSFNEAAEHLLDELLKGIMSN